MYRNSLGLPVAALVAAVLGFFTLAADLGWLHVAHAPAGGPVVDGKISPGEYAHQYTDNGISSASKTQRNSIDCSATTMR